jgi:hypothetical protein
MYRRMVSNEKIAACTGQIGIRTTRDINDHGQVVSALSDRNQEENILSSIFNTLFSL